MMDFRTYLDKEFELVHELVARKKQWDRASQEVQDTAAQLAALQTEAETGDATPDPLLTSLEHTLHKLTAQKNALDEEIRKINAALASLRAEWEAMRPKND